MLVYDNINTNGSSFNTSFRSGNGKAFVQAYAESGIVANTPMLIQFGGSGYVATLISACTNEQGWCGVPERVLASGCVGWVQVRGQVDGTQSPISSFYTGSVGHAVIMGATATAGGLHATGGANTGNQIAGQVGVLLEETNNSTTGNIYLTGVWATVLDMG